MPSPPSHALPSRPGTDTVSGCLLGTALGDALGLPYEGLSPRRAARLLGPPERFRLIGQRGLLSDDTEHACLVAQALIASGANPAGFARQLGWGLRWWFASLPAGIGLATLRACIKLWIGFPPHRSGVFSAGNGPAMRAPLLGLMARDDSHLFALVAASTRITHRDPQALGGALAAAVAARMAHLAPVIDVASYRAALAPIAPPATYPAIWDILDRVGASLDQGQDTLAFAASQGWQRGISGYINHSMAVVLHAWLSHPQDYRHAIQTVIRCGGDADTTAAILGGILGARVGQAGLPPDWLHHLGDWPRSTPWICRLAQQLAESDSAQPPPRLWLPVLHLRNAAFMVLVLAHGLRRLLPPY